MQITWSPTLSDELSLRIGPLRQAWEAYGPGLLKGIAAKVGAGVLVDAATIVPIAPEHGGGGEIDAARRIVKIEAVLTNPHPQLPEVVRMAWLLAHLGIDDEASRMRAWSLALAAVVLSAAEGVELAHCKLVPLTHAIIAWNIVDPPHQVAVGHELWALSPGTWDSAQALDEGVSALAHTLARRYGIGGAS